METYSTRDFWLQTLERAIKTFCQTIIGAVGVTAVAIQEIPWTVVLATAATTTVLSVLTSIASSGIGDRNSPSVVPVTVPEPSVTPVEAVLAETVAVTPETFIAPLPLLQTGGVVNNKAASVDPANDLTQNANIVRGEN